MFLDESGDHNLLLIDPQYPVFVLGGIIVDSAYADGELTDRVSDFKRRLFGHDDLILHTADIARNKNGFESIKTAAVRDEFYRELNKLMGELDYQVVACVIRKNDHRDAYGDAAIDPYMLSLNVLVERFCYEIGDRVGGGCIIAECRSPDLDAQLNLAWQEIRASGTYHIPAKTIRRRIASFTMRRKNENQAGLQIADLIVSPIGRFVMGKPVKDDSRIIERKFRRNARGDYAGYGLVELPRKRPAPATQ